MRLTLAQNLCFAGLAAASLCATASVSSASLLDQPPKVISLKLDDPAASQLPLLGAFQNASIERPGPMRVYLSGQYGQWRRSPWWNLEWRSQSSTELPQLSQLSVGAMKLLDERLDFEPTVPTWLRQLDPTFSSTVLASTGPGLVSNGFDVVWEFPKKPVVDWRCRRRPVQFVRYGGESDTFLLVRCDGSVAPEALDRLSIVARPPEVKSPGNLLPDEPEPDAWQEGEWLPMIRLVHPRLLWALQRVADAFPYRAIYVFSGYRPRSLKRTGHHSLHGEGRAMDIVVMGIPNFSLFNFCRTLDDVGCGYYPNSKFVHIDVRRPGTGHAFWIDISGPGEAPKYVDTWPGVVGQAAPTWNTHSHRRAPPVPSPP